MSVGISSYGAYVPRFRLGKSTAGWELSAEKPVANYDEDSITMSVAAGADCLAGIDRSTVDACFFASTTAPYSEKQAATTVATALDLRRDIVTSDFGGTPRAAATALRSALDALLAGTARKVLVVAADCRMGVPKGDFDQSSGDGAAALLLSRQGLLARIDGSYSLADQMLDQWRAYGDSFMRDWEDRFIAEEGFQRIMVEASRSALEKFQAAPQDFARAIYYAPTLRRHRDIGRMLGFSPEQVQVPLFGSLNNTGTAYVLMLLVAALETARPGQRFYVQSYGDGSDIYLMTTTERVAKGRGHRGVAQHLESKAILPKYEEYLKWRNLLASEGVRRPPIRAPSVSALWRQRDQIIRLHGVRCLACGHVQYPPQVICSFCHTRGNFERVRLSDRKGELFTYSMDYLSPFVEVPLVVSVVNFEGGGRIICTMTDRVVEEVRVGMPVEMSFRKLYTAGGIHNYFWKSTPVRG